MDKILLGHGSGGKLMHALINEHFSPVFGNSGAGDSAVVGVRSQTLAYTTDSYVVSPLFFPGGNIGDLAVCGTVNDLSVAGAEPLYLTAGFIIEEGFPMADLKRIIASMASAAKRAGVKIVAGDTKVVNRGKADGVFINTSGIGVLENGIDISPKNIREGDAVIISGELGNHGVAILAERNGLTFEPPVVSDTRPLNGLVRAMYQATSRIRFMRDPTRGGLATTLKEAALESGLCIRIREQSLPVPPPVSGACSLLGLDPLYVANEGILTAVVDPVDADRIVAAMRAHEHGRSAAVIGTVDRSAPGMVLLETAIGGSRILDMLPGEMLPRIC
ncbi:MAG: hydrogenase expression/formation protein HypE [Nitrospirae bacterium]|nr:hydrogenase expression/formation protein HypE [Nitrospirota bacterium]NTW66927.1 hydrogenase expression/formation protein HypE [Nitrospirota bacterium]